MNRDIFRMTSGLKYIVLAFGSILLFQNCEPSFLVKTLKLASSHPQASADENEYESVYAQSKLILDQNILKQNEAFLTLNKLSANSNFAALNMDSAVLPKGFELTVSIDNNCTSNMLNAVGVDTTKMMSTKFMMTNGVIGNLAVQNHNYKIDQDITMDELEAQLNADPCVIGASEETIFHANFNDDPQFNNQLYLRQIKSPEGHPFFWQSDFKVSTPVVIAIIDTGIDQDHEDLRNRLWDDGNGNNGFDFVNNDNNPNDDQGHGTHCAGLSAMESNNRVGGSGVFGFQAQLMGIKVLGADGSGNSTNIANGIRFAADNQADIINMSLGGTGRQTAMLDAINYAIQRNVTVVVAAGNDNTQVTSNNYSPGGFGFEVNGLLTIGSIDENNLNKSGFSNFSTTHVELTAPGSGNGGGVLSTYNDGGYRRLQGTSMATPVAVGVTSLAIGFFKSNNITYNPAMIEEIMLTSAFKDSSLSNNFKDGNRVDVERLSQFLQNSYVLDSPGGFNESF